MTQRRGVLIAGLATLHAAQGRTSMVGWDRNEIAAPPSRPTTLPLQVGVATHYGMYGESLDTLQQLGRIGLRSLRDEAYWSHVEISFGSLALPAHVVQWYGSAMRAGIAPLLLLSYGHPSYQGGERPTTSQALDGFARYATFMAQSLPGIRQFQVWNEWELADSSGRPGGADDYLKLFRGVAPQLRAIRAGALVLPAGVQRAGCFNGYLESLVRGGLLRWADGVALHTYRFERADPSPEAWYRELLQLALLIHRWDPEYGAGAPMYVTEMGFPSHTGRHGLSLQAQANYLERCVLLAAALPALRGFWWYGLRDKGSVPNESEHHYGLLAENGSLKPSGNRMQQLLERLRGATRISVTSQSRACWEVALEMADGSTWQARWSPAAIGPGSTPVAGLEPGQRPVWSQLKPPAPKTARP
jgi:polysaccharide biosynthesis protein PslG